jgi:hypothetical protein
MSTSVSANLAQVRKRIELACLAVGRSRMPSNCWLSLKPCLRKQCAMPMLRGNLRLEKITFKKASTRSRHWQICPSSGIALVLFKAIKPSWWPKTLHGCTALTVSKLPNVCLRNGLQICHPCKFVCKSMSMAVLTNLAFRRLNFWRWHKLLPNFRTFNCAAS